MWGGIFAATVAGGALRTQALDRGGAIAALAVGTLTYGAAGWPGTLVLLAFFVPSVALSRLGRRRKKMLVDIGKGGARDGWQVLANGGAATLCVVIAGLASVQSRRSAEVWIAAFAGAYAAATADTWGTEIGTFAGQAPRSILTGKPIASGLSGGVTVAGTLAEVAGALYIAGCTLAAFQAGPKLFVAVGLGGVTGAVLDSLLGATIQELRYCAPCARNCEIDPHVCGMPTVVIRGVAGFSNDLVNAVATASGAGTAALLAMFTHRLFEN